MSGATDLRARTARADLRLAGPQSPVAAKARPPKVGSEWVRRGRSRIHGGGLYARKPIPKGTRVIEYVGERITKAEALRREQRRLAAGGSVYVFELNARYDIDGDVPWNLARLINHSCEGNCETDIIRGHIWIIASRDIAAGEELSYDYGFDYAEWRNHPCRCGSPKCVGYIVHQKHRWRVRKILKAERAASARAIRQKNAGASAASARRTRCASRP